MIEFEFSRKKKHSFIAYTKLKLDQINRKMEKLKKKVPSALIYLKNKYF